MNSFDKFVLDKDNSTSLILLQKDLKNKIMAGNMSLGCALYDIFQSVSQDFNHITDKTRTPRKQHNDVKFINNVLNVSEKLKLQGSDQRTQSVINQMIKQVKMKNLPENGTAKRLPVLHIAEDGSLPKKLITEASLHSMGVHKLFEISRALSLDKDEKTKNAVTMSSLFYLISTAKEGESAAKYKSIDLESILPPNVKLKRSPSKYAKNNSLQYAYGISKEEGRYIQYHIDADQPFNLPTFLHEVGHAWDDFNGVVLPDLRLAEKAIFNAARSYQELSRVGLANTVYKSDFNSKIISAQEHKESPQEGCIYFPMSKKRELYLSARLPQMKDLLLGTIKIETSAHLHSLHALSFLINNLELDVIEDTDFEELTINAKRNVDTYIHRAKQQMPADFINYEYLLEE